MISATMIHRYGICGVWNSTYSSDYLFSGNEKDPVMMAHVDGCQLVQSGGKMDYCVGFGAKGVCIVQIVIFKTEMGYKKYLEDGVVIFDN